MRLFVIHLLAVLLAGCARAPESAPTVTAVLRLTLERTATPTAVATAAAWPTLTPHVFCEGAQESFLVVGERARVTLSEDGKWLNLRAGPGIEFDLVARMAPLEDFLVLDGARCGGPYTWFQVDYRGTVGWIAEGIEGQYFAEPWLPG